MRRWLVLLVGLALGCAMVAAQSPARHFLWKVTSKTGATAHLLGSVHVLKAGFYPLSRPIDEAFAASKVLVEEIDLDEAGNPASMMALIGNAVFRDGRTLEQTVSKETFEAVRTRADKSGIPLSVVNLMKPWMVALTLTAPALKAAGFDSGLGIDRHYFDRAKTDKMERRALETVAYQLERFDGLSPQLQEATLTAMLADLDAQVANIDTLTAAWAAGETHTLEKLLLEGFAESPELYERLVTERNRNWVPHVERCLVDNARCFVVVGAAHLVGKQSLVGLLRDKGYTVEQQ